MNLALIYLQFIYKPNSCRQASYNVIKKRKINNCVLNKLAFPEILDFSTVIKTFFCIPCRLSLCNTITFVPMNNITTVY